MTMTYQVEAEFEELKKIVTDLAPRKIMEIGSLTGETLWHWIGLAKESVLSLDMMVEPGDWRHSEQKHGHDYLWPQWADRANVKFRVINGDSTNETIIETVYAHWGAKGSIDFLFIDGGHDFRTAALDYANYAPLVRKGGVIAFHDRSNIDWPEVEIFWKAIKRGYRFKEIGGRMGIGVLYVE